MQHLISATLVCVCVFVGDVRATVTTTFNYNDWQSMVGEYSTIPFTGFPNGTPINNQYAGLGVTFTGPAFIFASNGMVNDGWGLHGPSGLHLYCNQPQSWIAIHHAGNAYFKLHSAGQLIGTSGFNSIGGFGSVLGITSSLPFDEVIITKPPEYGTSISVDDLHWGGAVPAPGSLALLALAALWPGTRRRRSH